MQLPRFFRTFRLRRDNQLRLLLRGIGLAALVGVASGAAAILLHAMIVLVMHVALRIAVGYDPGGPVHESTLPGFIETSTSRIRLGTPWLLLIIPALGGLVSGLLTNWLAPDAAGAGMGGAIDAFHNKRGFIPLRVPLVKMIATAATLGTGGSGGREGPIAQIGAGVGSFIATQLRLTESERRVLMAAGLGAGIGAIFHAPLAGAIFAIEVLYRDPDFEAEALIPAFMATTLAYSVYSLAYGFGSFEPLFEVTSRPSISHPLLLLMPLAMLAITMSGMGLIFVKVLAWTRGLFERMPIPAWLKPGVGGLVTGVLAVTAYHAVAGLGPVAQWDALSVLATGYGFLQKVLAGQLPATPAAALIILLLIGFGKMVTSSATIGSGGSGGTFGPSMVIGATCGAAFGLVLHLLAPDVVTERDVVIFAILGMASFFTATCNTPVSSLIMVTELTSSYALLLPAMWVCALAYLTSRGWGLYDHVQAQNRIESPAHRGDFIIDILKGTSVDAAITEVHRRFITVTRDTPMGELSRMITATLQTSFPVLDDEGNYDGIFSLNDIRQFLYDQELGPLATAEDLAVRVEPLTLDMDLSDAISRFAQGRFEELPVVANVGAEQVVAMLRRQDVISVYDRKLLELRAG